MNHNPDGSISVGAPGSAARENSASNHTPGPWEITPGATDGNLHVRAVSSHDVALVPLYARAIDRQQHANARIIHAAPDAIDFIRATLPALPSDELRQWGERVLAKAGQTS